ncbi:flagellar biosynthetic protein FliO [Fervidibacillus halotolerans]|uniref:Flagellar biosynthetic protein FliO n=1 Tax=Fervidibacillus halotolerans TaxID=2980027 RepID=A0A9E8S1J5_9BACI|nr:flagellar biosynthetic protein FliO [Fervidibacillus halotolerans]WAA13592.1 flagellar biosynthetic protein FliO [Fervidibacillus halotolerans]
MKQKLMFILMPVLLSSFLSFFLTIEVFAQSESNTSVSDWIQQQGDSVENGDVEKRPSDSDSDDHRVGIGVWDVIKSIFALVFVLFLLVIVLRWLQRKNGQIPPSQIIRPIAGMNLGGNRSIQIVKIGDKLYMIGVGENIELLKEIDERSEIEGILKMSSDEAIPLYKNKDLFKNLLNRFNHTFQKQNTSSSFKQEMENQFDRILKERKEAMKGKVERGINDE